MLFKLITVSLGKQSSSPCNSKKDVFFPASFLVIMQLCKMVNNILDTGRKYPWHFLFVLIYFFHQVNSFLMSVKVCVCFVLFCFPGTSVELFGYYCLLGQFVQLVPSKTNLGMKQWKALWAQKAAGMPDCWDAYSIRGVRRMHWKIDHYWVIIYWCSFLWRRIDGLILSCFLCLFFFFFQQFAALERQRELENQPDPTYWRERHALAMA